MNEHIEFVQSMNNKAKKKGRQYWFIGVEFVDMLLEQILTAQEGECINIVLAPIEGTPNYEFVEIENDSGQSVRVGEWLDYGEYKKIRIPPQRKVNDE